MLGKKKEKHVAEFGRRSSGSPFEKKGASYDSVLLWAQITKCSGKAENVKIKLPVPPKVAAAI